MTVAHEAIQPIDDGVEYQLGFPFFSAFNTGSGTNRIAQLVLDIINMDEASITGISAESADLPDATCYVKYVAVGDQVALSASVCVAVPDDYEGDLEISVTVDGDGGEAPRLKVSSAGVMYTGAAAADATMDVGYAFLERDSFDNTDLEIALGAVGVDDMAVVVAGAFRNNGGATLTVNDQIPATTLAVSIGGDLGTGITALSPLIGEFDGLITVHPTSAPNAYPYAALGFIFSAASGGGGGGGGSDATGYNCACEDAPANKTLAAYRYDLLVRLGFAAVAKTPPPGMAELCDSFLQSAQERLYLEYPALWTRRFFRWQMEAGKRFYGIRENFEGADRTIVTISTATPAVVTWPTVAPPDGRLIDFSVEEGDALPYPLQAGTQYYVIESGSGTCQLSLIPGGDPIATTFGGQGVITAHGDDASCVFDMEPYKEVEGVWVRIDTGQWIPLGCGIPPEWYTTVLQPGIPSRYEIRSCIEVFPAPASGNYQLFIKGHFGLRPFQVDTDRPTIDGQLMFLTALADGLAHYNKSNAIIVGKQATKRLKNLVAGTHLTKRYVPGAVTLPPSVMPIFIPLNGAPP